MSARNRLSFNLNIIALLETLARKLPEFRFQQLLWAVGIIDGNDNFYEEPWDTMDKLMENPIVCSSLNCDKVTINSEEDLEK